MVENTVFRTGEIEMYGLEKLGAKMFDMLVANPSDSLNGMETHLQMFDRC